MWWQASNKAFFFRGFLIKPSTASAAAGDDVPYGTGPCFGSKVLASLPPTKLRAAFGANSLCR